MGQILATRMLGGIRAMASGRLGIGGARLCFFGGAQTGGLQRNPSGRLRMRPAPLHGIGCAPVARLACTGRDLRRRGFSIPPPRRASCHAALPIPRENGNDRDAWQRDAGHYLKPGILRPGKKASWRSPVFFARRLDIQRRHMDALDSQRDWAQALCPKGKGRQ